MAASSHFRRFVLLACLCSGTGLHAQLTSIPGLFTTGVKNSGSTLGNNVPDSHYVVTASSAGDNYTGAAYTVKSNQLDPGWTGNSNSARWIVAPMPGTNDGNDPTRPAGTYDYTLTFDMPAGAQLTMVAITGEGAADNSADIYVNGVLVSGETLAGPGASNAFTLNSSNAAFVSGSNTITFRVTNTVAGSATGLLISSFSGSVIVPEVGAWLPIAGALSAFAFVRGHRWWKEKAHQFKT